VTTCKVLGKRSPHDSKLRECTTPPACIACNAGVQPVRRTAAPTTAQLVPRGAPS
jgi:hypothetical protein